MDEDRRCALWWWSHGAVEVEVFDTEIAAVRYGMGVMDDDRGAVAGAQFPDGRYVEREEWTAWGDEQRRLLKLWSDRAGNASPPRPYRRVTAPWGGVVVGIDADLPSWVGAPRPENDR